MKLIATILIAFVVFGIGIITGAVLINDNREDDDYDDEY